MADHIFKMSGNIVYRIFELFVEELNFPRELWYLDSVLDAYSENRFRLVEKNGRIVYALQFHIFGEQMYESYRRHREVPKGLNLDLGTVLYVTNVVSFLPHWETTWLTKRITREILGDYPQVARIEFDREKNGEWSHHTVQLKRGKE
jgi:hypothetical protein